jgi:predicted ATP-grasp superfamily ATP-dependent carboligase/cellulose synthase/poly-beta-1,6-N-acetylglucosamine synthase-like glycosyltransferase
MSAMSQLGWVVFWGSVGLVAYTFVGFPLLLLLVSSRRQRRIVRKRDVEPRVSLIVAAFNEEATVAAKLDNSLALDYAPNRLEVVVASDGSTDATEEIASGYDPARVRLLRLPRRGKIHALDEAVRHATGSVLVFSDANTMLEEGALRALVSNFGDLGVGGVVGNTGYRLDPGAESSGRGESLYWRYDKWLKALESRTGSVVSAHGGLYAIRWELYRKPEEAAVTDDFAISTGVVQQGYRLVFEPEARAWEETAPGAGGEFGRRVRLMTRGLRAVTLRRGLLNPFRYGFYAVVLFTHKVLRRMLPLTLPLLLFSSAQLAQRGLFYQAALGAQALFYALAGVGYLFRRRAVGRSKLLYAPFYFTLANAAGLVAIWKFAKGQRISTWEPVRPGLSAAAAGTPAARPPTAVVIGLDSATGLQTARILRARGVPVVGVAADPHHPCCRTRSCGRVIAADTSGTGLVDALLALASTLEQKAVLFPCTDDSVQVLSRHRAELESSMHMVLPPQEVVELLIDKASFYGFAESAGFRVPTTFVLHDRRAAAEAAMRLRYPCILKPAVKTQAWKQSTRAKAFRVEWAGELLALFDRYSPHGLLIVQEWVRGADTDHYTCNGYFGAGAEPLVTFTSRKLRQWPPTGGEGCLSEEVRNEVVRDETVRLFRQVQHRGLGYAELKLDELTHQYVILEPNICRPTGRSAQAEAAGVELIYTQYCDALGWPLPPNRQQEFRGVKWIHFRRDFQASLHQWRKGELSLVDWARSWKGPKTDALFSLKDPIPFLADLTRVAFRRARRGERAERAPLAQPSDAGASAA